jgi:hypothetical protein
VSTTPQNPLPDLDADWRSIRRLADAIAECVDTTVQELIDEFDLPDDEATINAFTDYVAALATIGNVKWEDVVS